MNHHFKDYFTFSKKERTGIIVLLLLIGLTYAAGYFMTPSPTQPDEAVQRQFRQQAALLKAAMDSGSNEGKSGHFEKLAEYAEEPTAYAPAASPGLFTFDPNTLSTEGWKKLGIPDRTIATILHYRDRGGRFRKPEDLYKIYGMKPADCVRLIDWVHIPVAQAPVVQSAQREETHSFIYDSSHRKYNKPAFVPPAIIDINTADTTAFIALRGIGSKLAGRIVRFREKLGGFYAVEQVGETYGLPDSTFQQIRVYLQCTTPVTTTIPINTADVTVLREHPYIRWQLANTIVQYRQQHGPFYSVDELLKINLITPGLLAKIKPYLTVGEKE